MSPPREEGTPLSADSLAAEAERGGDSYRALPQRLARYGVARERALAMRDYLSRESVQHHATRRAAHELHHCGNYLVFRRYFESDRTRLVAFRSCKQHIVCPLCAIRRGAKMLARYVERLEHVLASTPGLTAHMTTLTVKNGVDLGERYRHLNRSVRAFHRRRINGAVDSEARKILGAVWSYEFKRGRGSGLWHPHMHAVWLTHEAPDAARLSDEWRSITGDSFIVETHPLHGAIVDASAEVFKYAVKFGDLPLADNWHAQEVLRGRRLVACSGLLWGVEVPDELTDELLPDEMQWVDELYRHVRGVGYERHGVINSSEDCERQEGAGGTPVLASAAA